MKKTILMASTAMALVVMNVSASYATNSCSRMCGKYCCDDSAVEKGIFQQVSDNEYKDLVENVTYKFKENSVETRLGNDTVVYNYDDEGNLLSKENWGHSPYSVEVMKSHGITPRVETYQDFEGNRLVKVSSSGSNPQYITDSSLVFSFSGVKNSNDEYIATPVGKNGNAFLKIDGDKSIIDAYTYVNKYMGAGQYAIVDEKYNTLTYDKEGNLREKIDKDSLGNTLLVTTYDAQGNVISETAKDAEGNITSALTYDGMNYDSVGHLLGYKKESTVYNSDGTYETTGTQYSACKGAAGGCTITNLGKRTYASDGSLLKVGNKAVTSDCAEADINANCTQCSGQYVLSEGLCFAPWEKKHYTPAEAAKYLKDTDNTIIITFKIR